MAVDLSTLSPPFAVRRVLLGDAGDVTRIDLPAWCRYLSVQFVRADGTTADSGQIASTGTDGEAASEHAWAVGSGVAVANLAVSDGLIPHGTTGPTRSIYLSGGTAAGYAQLLLQRDAS